MKTATCAGMLAIGIVIAAGSGASAENLRANTGFWGYHNNRYCLTTMTGELRDCAYPSFQSCIAASSGVGGTCTENFRVVDRTERPAPRRHRSKHVQH